MIIKEADVVIAHFGIQGMRWGVRNEENRSKARNIIKTQGKKSGMNRNDLEAADWMQRSTTNKVTSEIFKNTISVVVPRIIWGDLNSLKNPKELTKIAISVATKSAISGATKEITSSKSLKRYKQSGEKDLSKKQYRSDQMTPEKAVQSGVRLAVAISPFVKAYASKSIHTAAENKRANRKVVEERMKSWGPNLLDKKTSEFHTIYDDGYMSVLERIKKG